MGYKSNFDEPSYKLNPESHYQLRYVPIELQTELHIKLQIELQACELSFELSCELNLWHSKDLTNVTQVR